MQYLILHRNHKNCLRVKIIIIINETVTIYTCYLNRGDMGLETPEKEYDIIYEQSLMQISTMNRKIYKIFTNSFYRLTCPYSPPCSS